MRGGLKHISSTGHLNNTVSFNGNYKLSVKHYTKRTLQSVNIPLVHLGMNICCICIQEGDKDEDVWFSSSMLFPSLQGSRVLQSSTGWCGLWPKTSLVAAAVITQSPGLFTVMAFHKHTLPILLCVFLSSQVCTVLLEGVPGDSRGPVLWRAVHPAPLHFLPGQNPPDSTMRQISLTSWPCRRWGCPHQPEGCTSFGGCPLRAVFTMSHFIHGTHSAVLVFFFSEVQLVQ